MKEIITYEEPKLINLSNNDRPTSEGISTTGTCDTGVTADYNGGPYVGGYYFNCIAGLVAEGWYYQ